MTVRSDNRLWVRLLDGDLFVVAEQPAKRLYPATLDELAECVNMAINPPPGAPVEAHAIGSHWGISHTGVTTGLMIETATPVHEPDGDQSQKRLNSTLYDVIPDCLTSEALRFFYAQNVPTFNPAATPTHQEIYLFHVEAGARIFELYAQLDVGDVGFKKRSLGDLMKDQGAPNDYSGPWALESMGGAGGQTVVGAFSTGTHGGDVAFGPIADAVLAVHLIGADGQQYWIERTQLRPTTLPMQLIDETKLKARFPRIVYRRSDDLMNAVTVACGRMGVIYSVVLRVVRQFALEEKCRTEDWNDVKKWITGGPSFPTDRFVRIDVNAYGNYRHPSQYDCYVLTRNAFELDKAGKGTPLGRAERGGANAGRSSSLGKGDGFFSNPCASDNWIRAALNELESDISDVRDKAIKTWLVCAAVIAFPLTPPSVRAAAMVVQDTAATAIATATALIAVVEFLIEEVIPNKAPFGDTVAALTNYLASNGLFSIYRFVYGAIAKSMHDYAPDHPRTPAISYAAMDEHDYVAVGCTAPADSIEIFFDATSPNLGGFIDTVLARVVQLQNGMLENGSPAAFGGYISIRFMAQSPAYIAMQKWPRTCSIEIAGLARVEGTEPFLKQVEQDAGTFGAALHWGQRNNWSMKRVEAVHYPVGPLGDLFKWRAALSELTEHGRYAVFSTAFSKQMGLEITTPIIGSFSAAPTDGCANDLTTVTWEAVSNPPETRAFLVQTPTRGNPTRLALDGLSGSHSVPLGAGRSTLSLVLERELNGNIYRDRRDLSVRGFSNNDDWTFTFSPVPRLVDGLVRWTAEINLFSQFIANTLRVAEIDLEVPGFATWWVRNPDLADLQFTPSQHQKAIPSLPVFNRHWLFFSHTAATGAAPVIRIVFKLVC
jgi:hypothetical protein